MKRTILSLLLLVVVFSSNAQNRSVCRLGITYDISYATNWGKGKPVITGIIPYTPAEVAGLKQNDIITAIDGIELINISVQEIKELLNPAGQDEVLLTIKNLTTPAKQVLVKKECKKSNVISEEQLANAFSMYSLETNSERDFVAPYKTHATTDAVDFTTYKTFAFSSVDQDNNQLESKINNAIENELVKKGLKVDIYQPDMLIQTFYFFDKNPNYKGTNKLVVNREPVYRYNAVTNKMTQYPFITGASGESEAEYLLQFGMRFIDQRDVPGRILWESEANELLENSFRLEEYAQSNVPLMLMQYPYVKYERSVPFIVTENTYNYTGLNYDMDHLNVVADVDRNSPAYAAGIRARDVIDRINDNKMDYTTDEYSAAYKAFITNTMKYRDPKTMFSDINGFTRCMFWNAFDYPQVADALQKPANRGGFSYLFYYAPYINPKGNNACTFDIKRGKNKLEVTVLPTIRRSLTVELK